MSLPALLLIAFGVSADAFAVALTQGLRMRRRVLRNAVVIAGAFAVFQVVMPLIGWSIGTLFAGYITAVDHWVAFVLLVIIGGRMVWEAMTAPVQNDSGAYGLDLRRLVVLSFATSVDALAVGISFAFLDVNIWLAVGLVGVTTLVLSVAAVFIGQRVGARFKKPAELAGGIVLIFIGVQVLLEHLGVW
ncbi:manganese efflux pump MntP family protein [uncultured Amnibacterium sp.]|uniref:manganese efflux pump MntP n=1 Tax=uncultured Amnibacterium sp. TaxID=1631851 RepID=UPI0035C9EC2B